MFSEVIAHITLSRPGTLIDVGAHKGAFTIPFAKLLDTSVLAFEPIPDIAAQLQERLEQELPGQWGHVAVFPVAIGDLPGRTILTIPTLDGNPIKEWASIAKDFDAMRAEDPLHLTEPIRHEVDVWTIDSLNLHDVTGIKIDAEGNEMAVVRGARDTIARCKPFITLELEERHAAGCTWSVPAFLDALGYDGFFVYDDTVYPISALIRPLMHVGFESPAKREYSDPYIFEFYFIPRREYLMRKRFIELAEKGFSTQVDASKLSGRMITR
jgi:FkbM family methyltransferase